VRESRVAVPFSPPKQVVPTIREVLAVEDRGWRMEDRGEKTGVLNSIFDPQFSILVSDSGGGWS